MLRRQPRMTIFPIDCLLRQVPTTTLAPTLTPTPTQAPLCEQIGNAVVNGMGYIVAAIITLIGGVLAAIINNRKSRVIVAIRAQEGDRATEKPIGDDIGEKEPTIRGSQKTVTSKKKSQKPRKKSE